MNRLRKKKNYIKITLHMGKSFTNLMTMFLMVIMVACLASCEKLTNNMSTTEDKDYEPVVPVSDDPDWDVTYIIINDGTAEVDIEYTIKDTKNRISDTGRANISCWHQNDKYAGPKTVSLAYSQGRTSHGAMQTSTKSSSDDRKVYEDSGKTTSDVEDGNIVFCQRKMERIVRTISGKNYNAPYVKIGEPYLEAINQLPGTTKYGTRGDQVITDSVCRGFVWKAPCTVENYSKEEKFTVTLGDTVRVYQLSDNEIVSGKIVRTDRTPVDENTERCDIVIEWTMLDGSTHEQTFSKILKRRIETIEEYEKVVTAFGYNWLSDQPLTIGNASQVSKDENWTVSGRTDKFSGILTNNVAPVNTSYGLYHEKAEFANTKFALKHTFDFENWNPRERNTYEEDINSPRGGYTAKRLHNSISTSYLGYAQDASESVVLLMENAHETSQGWDKSKCTETLSDDKVTWHLEYVINNSDGSQERIKFDFSDSRILRNLGAWSSEELNNKYSTSGVDVKVTSTEPVSKSLEGAEAKWTRESRSLVSIATLNGSKQENKWSSVEPTGFSCTYRDKTFSFEANTLNVSNTDNLGNGVVNGSYTEYPYSDVLKYVWGTNVKSSTGNGTIKVKSAAPVPEEKTFFPPEWGNLLEAKQTVSNNMSHDGFVYIWSLHFEKGVLPVVVYSGETSPYWVFKYFEYTSNTDFNSATYQEAENFWINTVASDQVSQMTWSRDGKEKANKDYNIAKSQNWDEGHVVNRHASTSTSRYDLQVSNGRLTASDTYTGTYMGSWK